MSPTQRTLKLLRDRGYRVGIVEHWNHFAKCRVDLFGWIDILALKGSETLAVQCTSGDNVAARVTKIRASDALTDVRAAGWKVQVIGWRKNVKGRWIHREVEICE